MPITGVFVASSTTVSFIANSGCRVRLRCSALYEKVVVATLNLASFTVSVKFDVSAKFDTLNSRFPLKSDSEDVEIDTEVNVPKTAITGLLN